MTKPRDKVLKARLHERIDDVDALVEYVELLLLEDRVSEACKWLTKALAELPNNPIVLMTHATWLVRMERFDEARAAIAKAEGLGVDRAITLYALSQVAIASGDPAAAIILLEESLRFAPDNPIAQLELGTALLAVERWDDARRLFEEVLRADPGDLDARLGCADAYFELERFDRARFLYEQVLRDDPDEEDAVVGLADSFFALDREDEAMNALEEFIADRPKAIVALDGLMRLYQDAGHFGDAVEIGKRMIRIQDSAPLRTSVAGILVSQGKDDEGLDHARRALALESDFPPARLLIAAVAMLRMRWPEAESQLAQILVAHPEHPEALAKRGELRQRQGRTDEARADLELAVEIDPEQAAAWKHLSLVLSDLGEEDDAIDAVRKSIELEDLDPSAHQLLAILLLAKGDFAGAEQAIKAIEAIRPDAAETLRAFLAQARSNSGPIE